MNSDHEIEVTEESSGQTGAPGSASEADLDHAVAATVEAADLSEDGDDEEGFVSDEDGAEAANLSGDEEDEDEDDADDGAEAGGDNESEDDESEDEQDGTEEAA